MSDDVGQANVGACQFGCALAGTDDGSGDHLDQGTPARLL